MLLLPLKITIIIQVSILNYKFYVVAEKFPREFFFFYRLSVCVCGKFNWKLTLCLCLCVKPTKKFGAIIIMMMINVNLVNLKFLKWKLDIFLLSIFTGKFFENLVFGKFFVEYLGFFVWLKLKILGTTWWWSLADQKNEKRWKFDIGNLFVKNLLTTN